MTALASEPRISHEKAQRSQKQTSAPSVLSRGQSSLQARISDLLDDADPCAGCGHDTSCVRCTFFQAEIARGSHAARAGSGGLLELSQKALDFAYMANTFEFHAAMLKAGTLPDSSTANDPQKDHCSFCGNLRNKEATAARGIAVDAQRVPPAPVHSGSGAKEGPCAVYQTAGDDDVAGTCDRAGAVTTAAPAQAASDQDPERWDGQS